jgi:hypothetical protein
MRLLDVVAQVESSGNQFAIRRESSLILSRPVWLFGVGNANENLLKQHNALLDEATATACVCSSWGLYQILGGNLYAPNVGLAVSILDYLCNTSLQEEYALKFMSNIEFNGEMQFDDLSASEVIEFAERFNGPGQPEVYAAALRRAAARG